MPRIILATNDRLGLSALNGLMGTDVDVAGVLHFDSPRQVGYVPIDMFDVDEKAQVGVGGSMRDAFDWIVDREADLILCCGWSKVVPDEIRDWFPVVSMHPTKLPPGHVGSPIVGTILGGARETAVSFYMMNGSVDCSDVMY